MKRSALFCIVFLALSSALQAAERQLYLKDFTFIKKTVAARSASLKKRKIDWEGACRAAEPLFRNCASHADHVKNVRKLLALLSDSHSSVVRSSVSSKELPSKWDGLYGGGLWFAWENGRIMLRGVMERHSLSKSLPAGSTLVKIEETPAWLIMAREKARITRYTGSSSDHSLFSSMGNRMLPFGEKRTLSLTFLTPELQFKTVKVDRWGPGGKAFYPYTVQLPDGLEYQRGAVSTMLSFPWCKKVGYLRITGSMDTATAASFHKAFDALKGMEALILDCRGMGGGSDLPAWEMAGRLFPKQIAYGAGRTLSPSGSWQFPGPVVMLQDETEVSSAETFTWAVSETGRVVSVGRYTGGWGIIPRVFKCPSGLVDFRLGVVDRRTPLRGILTEGIGWPPDICIPYGPVFCGMKDPARTVAMDVLSLLHAGVDRKSTVGLYQSLFSGQIKSFQKSALKLKSRISGWKPESLQQLVLKDIKATCAVELALLKHPQAGVPGMVDAAGRFKALSVKAKNAGLSTAARSLQAALSAARREIAAQKTAVKLFDFEPDVQKTAAALFLKKYGRTRIGAFIRKHGLPVE